MTTSANQPDLMIRQGPDRVRLARSFIHANNATASPPVSFTVSTSEVDENRVVRGEVTSLRYATSPAENRDMMLIELAVDGDFENPVAVVYDAHKRIGMMSFTTL